MYYNLDSMGAIAKGLDSFYRDCAITVALKISDDSCKMDHYEKSVFMLLYKHIEKKSDVFEADVFDLIEQANTSPSATIYADIKKRREAAMDFITRPKMKAFKSDIRDLLSE